MQVVIATKNTRPNRRGRPRKANVRRDKAGISRGEIVDITAILNQPHRRGNSDPQSALLGHALGRLAKRGFISEQQYRVGDRWAYIVRSYRRELLSAPPISARSSEMSERVSSGFCPREADIAHELDPEQMERRRQELKDKYQRCFEALNELGRTMLRGHAILNVVRKVCVDDYDASEHEVGDLRLGLNSLSRLLFTKEELK